MTGWHFDPRDTPQHRRILRTHEKAQKARIKFAPGTRVHAVGSKGDLTGEVIRHIPGTNSQGGVLLVDWSNGIRGRVNPIAVAPIDKETQVSPLTATSPEPSEGSVVMTDGTTGTAWQRLYSDSKWLSVTGQVAEFADLFSNRLGQPRTVVLVHDTEGA